MRGKTSKYSFKGLQTFEAVARHQSLTKAADELGVTPSAVSHHLARLSDEVGERLLTRSGRSVVLTETGRQLAETLQYTFSQIESSVARVVGSGRDTIRIAMCSSFSPGWFMGRIGSLIEANPDTDIQVLMYAEYPELSDRVADAFVTTFPAVAGFKALKLMREYLVAVYKDGANIPNRGLPLITTDIQRGEIGADWVRFCEESGRDLSDLHTGRWLQCSHYILALQLAREGRGMALIPEFLAEKEMSIDHSLRRFDNSRMRSLSEYHLCIKSSRANEPPLRRLWDWFKDQLEE
jgi:LysR family glycine cleavage system transcriptional activator